MTVEPIKLEVSINDRDSVTGSLYVASKKERAGITVILGHGAGANRLSAFMRLFANGLAERGYDTMTFNFLYVEQGRHVPDPKPNLESCYRAVIEVARQHKKLKENRLVIGGKSMGGRIASQVAAAVETGLTRLTNDGGQESKKPNSKTPRSGDEKRDACNLAGLVLLGYPLHPPGNPEKLRDAHLPLIPVPMLFVQGSRDAFGTPEEIRKVIKNHGLPATLHIIEGGDHSFKVPKSIGVPQQEIYEGAMDVISRWLLASC